MPKLDTAGWRPSVWQVVAMLLGFWVVSFGVADLVD
jgi:hypothetical protein